jgi:hypothetical protein
MDWIDSLTTEPADMIYIYALQGAGYNVVEWNVQLIDTVDSATMDTLESAKLIILGRSIPTDPNFLGANIEVWNGLTVPIIQLSPWGARSNRLNWFNSTAATNINDSLVTYNAIIELPADPVFEGIDTSSPIPWWWGPISVLQTQDAGNGTVLARLESDLSVLFVRFEAGTEFYTGAGSIPGGPRTMIGNGNDNLRDAHNNPIIHYYNYSTQAEQILLAEVRRMFILGGGTPPSSVEEPENTPLNFGLCQNYPNPFNPTTNIDFSLAKPSHTTIQVFNVVGQLVETIVDQNFSAGTHTIYFQADNLSAGVYFYRIKTDYFTNIKKMILLK